MKRKKATDKREQEYAPVNDKFLRKKGITPDTERGRTVLNKFGEIVEPVNRYDRQFAVSDSGEQYYMKSRIEYINLQGPNHHFKEVELKPSIISPIVNSYINYLIDKKKVHLPKLENKKLVFKEGNIPFTEKEGEATAYSGKPIKLSNGKTMVLLDSRLSDSQKIATAYHELVHARGVYDEKEAHLETIYGLREMMKSYGDLIKNEDEWRKWFKDYDPDVLTNEGRKPGEIREAVNYAIRARSSFDVSLHDIGRKFKKSKLERKVEIIFYIMLPIFLAYFLFTPKLTGFVSLQTNYIAASFLGIIFFFFLVVFLYFKLIKKRKS